MYDNLSSTTITYMLIKLSVTKNVNKIQSKIVDKHQRLIVNKFTILATLGHSPPAHGLTNYARKFKSIIMSIVA